MHVVDSSLPGMEEQIQAVEDVLEEIGAKDLPTVMVFNKADKPHSQTLTLAFRHRYPGSVMVSAKTGEGMDLLKERILEFVNSREKNYTVRFNAANGALYAFLQGRCKVIEEDFEESAIVLTISADERILGELRENEDCQVDEVPLPFHDPWVSGAVASD